MQTSSVAQSLTSPGVRLPAWRWTLLACLFMGEGLWLTSAFDRPEVPAGGAWWAQLLNLTPYLLPASLAIGTSMVLFAGPELRRRFDQVHAQATSYAWRPYLAAHVVCLAGFAVWTHMFMGERFIESETQTLLVLVWGGLAFGATSTLAACAMPLRSLATVGVRASGVLLSGTVVGLGAWRLGRLTDAELWRPFGGTTLRSVEFVLGLLGGNAVLDLEAMTVGTSRFVVEIGIGCSGWEGIGLIWVFTSAYLWYFRSELRFPHALLLVPLGTLAMWSANVLRIASLVGVGTSVSAELAVGVFHARAGWLFFCGVAWALVVITRRMPFFSRTARPATGLRVDPTTAYIGPLLLLVGGSLLPIPAADAVRVGLAAGALFLLRERFREHRFGVSWVALLAGALVFGLWLALEPFAPERGDGPDLAAVGGAALALRVFGTVIVTPIAEELAFRGYLLRRLQNERFQDVPLGHYSALSFVASSVLFGLLHQNWIGGILAGMGYALVLYRRRRLWDAIVAHALTNALLTGYTLLA